LFQFLLIGGEQFGGSRGRGGSLVGHEVGDGEVHLVADSGHHRQGAGRQRPGHHLLVEGPQILQRAAAPGQDQHVALAPLAGQIQHAGNFGGGILALHGNRVDHHGNTGKAPPQGGEDVADRRPRGGGDDPDSPRQTGQGLLAFHGEQPFGVEPLAQRLEGPSQGAIAGFLHVFDDELELAPGLQQHPHLAVQTADGVDVPQGFSGGDGVHEVMIGFFTGRGHQTRHPSPATR